LGCFLWLGHRRFARHGRFRKFTLIADRFKSSVGNAIEDYLQRYQCMLAGASTRPGSVEKGVPETRVT